MQGAFYNMATRPKDNPPPTQPAPAYPVAHDPFAPIPVPDATEDNTDTTWALWQEASKPTGHWDDTVPMDLPDE